MYILFDNPAYRIFITPSSLEEKAMLPFTSCEGRFFLRINPGNREKVIDKLVIVAPWKRERFP